MLVVVAGRPPRPEGGLVAGLSGGSGGETVVAVLVSQIGSDKQAVAFHMLQVVHRWDLSTREERLQPCCPSWAIRRHVVEGNRRRRIHP